VKFIVLCYLYRGAKLNNGCGRVPSVKGNACLHCLNCTKFSQLILRKIINIIATRCQIFKAKMHQIRFRLGFCPRPRAGSTQRFPRALAGFKGAASRQGREGEGREREGRGMGREERVGNVEKGTRWRREAGR